MTKTRVHHTIDIFERMYSNMPPLVPKKIIEKMGAALEQAKGNSDLTEEELEHTMVVFAKKVWPYNQAFQELYHSYEARMGEKLFEQKLTGMLRKRYHEYRASGIAYRDFKKGSSLDFFSHDERIKLHALVVDVTCEIRRFAFQAVTHTDREQYEARIIEFKNILEHIELQLDALREVAEYEAEHPMLAAEIREHVRGFEHGFAMLGPRVDYRAVCGAQEHFEGRKKHHKVRVKHRG